MDLYIVLGVQRGATPGEIKRAYRRLARRYHPDINPGDREAATRFRQILEAYETLIDPDRRRRYDTGATSAPRERGRRVRLCRIRFLERHRRRTRDDVRRSVRGCVLAPLRPRPRRLGASTAPISISRQVSPSTKRGRALQWPVTAHAAGDLPLLRGLGLPSHRRITLRGVRRVRRRALGARAHGVLEELSALRRDRPAAATGVRDAVTGRASRRARNR